MISLGALFFVTPAKAGAQFDVVETGSRHSPG